jgi:2-amino-4-hydroxy-6-hydroxymethyldihydropteridine diphosphokinase
MILISVGANLPGLDGTSPKNTCIEAVAAIKSLPRLRFTTLSAWYRTAAMPKSDQPPYCNGIVRLEGDIGPEALLGLLQEIETRLGRVRRIVNDPRAIDLDIIDLNGIIKATNAPILPHPRAHLRAFVLRPILDVAPNWRHPTLHQGVAYLLASLPPQGIEPWPDTPG